MKTIFETLVVLSLLLTVSLTYAEVYKWVDEKGGVHFTEDPTAIPEKYRDAVKSRPTDEPKTNTKKYPSIEQVSTFPEKYLRYRMVFSGCRVSQDLSRADEICKGCYSIGVTSYGGKYVSPVVKRDGITFIVFDSLAEKLTPDFKGGYAWTDCDVTGTIIKREGYYIAVVSQIDVYIMTWPDIGHKVDKSYKDETLFK